MAICLLNAYANPAHERALAELVGRRLQHVVLTCSSDTAPEFREYERASTTVIAAHVQPVISEYLERFERHLASRGFSGTFSLMQSNGGRLPSTGMRRNPVTALFSGPAAGVMGAVRQSVQSGFASLITFDMGGTSTDVCFIQDGEPELNGQSAAVRARMTATNRTFNAVMKALARAVPEKVIATGFDTTTGPYLSRRSEAVYKVYHEVIGGGYGASARADGCSGVDGPLGNCSNVPVESLDMDFDLFSQLNFGRFHGTADLGPGLAVGDDAIDTDQVAHLGENRINPPRQSLESDRPPLWACNRHK